MLASSAYSISDYFQEEKRVPQVDSEWALALSKLNSPKASGSPFDRAEAVSELTAILLKRVVRTVDVWMDAYKSSGGFFPRGLNKKEESIWNYKDCAADLFGYLLLASKLLNLDHLANLEAFLQREREMWTGLPQGIDLTTRQPLGESDYWKIFGATEYAKDGLTPLCELFGDGDWRSRKFELLDRIRTSSKIHSDYGNLVGVDTETNGGVLQVLSRAYQKTLSEKFRKSARSIVEGYLFEVLPNCEYIPASFWNFTNHRRMLPSEILALTGINRSQDYWAKFRLRDHGNEIVGGIVEFLHAESRAPNNRIQNYHSAAEQMLLRIMKKGKDSDGMWMHEIAESKHRRPESYATWNDNWAYLEAAYLAYTELEVCSPEIRERIKKGSISTVKYVTSYNQIAWNGSADGYADAIEGALLIQNRLKEIDIDRWLNNQVGHLISFQKVSGFITSKYLDGNFIRTLLMFYKSKTEGAWLEPYREDVSLGAYRDGNSLYLTIKAKTDWEGLLHIDHKRHKINMGLSLDYARLNSWPEYYTVNESDLYTVMRKGGTSSSSSIKKGKELVRGLSISLPSGSLNLHIKPA